MKYKVTHLSSLSGDWVKTLCQRLIASYLQSVLFALEISLRCLEEYNLNEQDCTQLILAKDLSGRCHEPVTLADTAIL